MLSVLLLIVFLIRRNRQRKGRREAAHPFTDSLPTPPENARPVPGEKLRFTQILGGFRVRVSPKQGMVSITTSPESQSAPSSSAVVVLPGSQDGIATHSPSLEEPLTTRSVSIEPPPNYSP
ncbi:hypothetical protein BDZ94DRAFT_1263902 [Collybia nuda]|uniref:Uncharacterized protein n=1 Tax=Collybia nuda TaxID=64659 RepID=A0A9P5Y307_9AGAR|nr:hypothetical protein BDZ94DRAFT_1263902 [Collybia nuda]